MGMFINALRLSPTAAAVRQVENYTRPENKEKYGGKKENRRMRWLDNLFQHLVVVAVRCALPIFIYRNKLFRRWHCKKVNRRKIAGGGCAVAKVFPIYFDAFVGTRPFVCGDMSKYHMATVCIYCD